MIQRYPRPLDMVHARGVAPLGLREIDDGTIGIEDVPSTLFNVGIYHEAYG